MTDKAREKTVERLEKFRRLLQEYDRMPVRIGTGSNSVQRDTLRSEINKEIPWARQQVIEAKCFATMTISPPAAVGGLIHRGVDPFNVIFQDFYGLSVVSAICDMLDQTIGVILERKDEPAQPPASVSKERMENYAFIAMPMNKENPRHDDVLDSIKQACDRCGILGERVDEQMSNGRITDRILESIQRARFVIVDLTDSRPNVYFEAGYAHGINKIPIYIAQTGTVLEFDLKDYPVIFFKNMRELRELLETKLRALAQRK